MQTALWESSLPVLTPKICLNLLGKMLVGRANTWQRPVSHSSIQSGSSNQDYLLELCDLPVEGWPL